jgi:hypothetical protein
MKTIILFLLINSLFSQNEKIIFHTPTKKIPFRYMKETYSEIAVLTKDRTVEIEVTGPTWLKVNTRIPWHKDMEGEQRYTIIVQEDSLKETIFNKKTYLSNEIFGRFNTRYGESRYSLINVPEGKHVYTFYFWSAAPDTILLDFSFSIPNRWVEILPSSFTSTLNLMGDEEKQTYYTITPENPIKIKVGSPINIKIISRLNFDKSLGGRQGYTIIVYDKEKEIEKVSFVTEKSEIFEYEDRTDLIPSKENRFFLWFPRGSHTLTFHLEGTTAKSAALTILKEVETK